MKQFFIQTVLSLFFFPAFATNSTYADFAKTQHANVPPEANKVIDGAIAEIRKSHLSERALKVGQKMPDFILKDEHGSDIKLSDLRRNGPVVVTFYRGSWCPFCNLQLHLYQERLADFRSRHATLVAITPEKPDLILMTKTQNKLEFPVLTDTNNKLATKLGLVWSVPENLKRLSKTVGIDLVKSQGNPDWKLPVPATFVIDQTGTVKYAFVEADWSKRAEPDDILKTLVLMSAKKR